MNSQSGTMTGMGRRKKSDQPDSNQLPGKPRPGYPVFARVPEEVGRAMDSFIAAQRFPPEKAEVVETALREFLVREGFLKD